MAVPNSQKLGVGMACSVHADRAYIDYTSNPSPHLFLLPSSFLPILHLLPVMLMGKKVFCTQKAPVSEGYSDLCTAFPTFPLHFLDAFVRTCELSDGFQLHTLNIDG